MEDRMSVLRRRLIEIQEREKERLLLLVAEGCGENAASQLRSLLERQATETKAAQDENKRIVRALEDITPGGSEFVDDANNCIDYIKQRLATIPEMRRTIARLNKANTQAA